MLLKQHCMYCQRLCALLALSCGPVCIALPLCLFVLSNAAEHAQLNSSLANCKVNRNMHWTGKKFVGQLQLLNDLIRSGTLAADDLPSLGAEYPSARARAKPRNTKHDHL